MLRSFVVVMFGTIGMVAFAPLAESQPSDWRIEETLTETRYELGTSQTHLIVECVKDRFGGGAVLDIVVDGSDPEPRSRTEIFIDDTRYLVRHDVVGVGVTDCPDCAQDFRALWSALQAPNLDEITLKRGERREYLPAHGGETLGRCEPG
ncbi:hypothetical protein SAMN06297251_11256 [Fulvimarina manganoxydans]|uniref:Uncharacterized protein n=1 Tax=Fulvimarina manganoxydans TaxID=937218 RepID=A0A1W2D365_9HYPH|nr:hypothetical protein [Fulvimarina manganoxydans]SMC91478.1 hypothetical protein SAMN06297251_11256 [Fulvimarina manganoxydans]